MLCLACARAAATVADGVVGTARAGAAAEARPIAANAPVRIERDSIRRALRDIGTSLCSQRETPLGVLSDHLTPALSLPSRHRACHTCLRSSYGDRRSRFIVLAPESIVRVKMTLLTGLIALAGSSLLLWLALVGL